MVCSGGSCRGHIVAGPPETVASSAHAALEQLGFNVVPTGEGEDIRLNTVTKAGQQLTLVLSAEQTEAGKHTRLRFEWENGPDEDTETQILNHIEVRTRD
jgi:hypothetical protein